MGKNSGLQLGTSLRFKGNNGKSSAEELLLLSIRVACRPPIPCLTHRWATSFSLGSQCSVSLTLVSEQQAAVGMFWMVLLL